MKKFIITIVTTCLLAMTSCETTISDYNTEIEDAVRTFLASTELRANYMLEDDAEEFVDDLYREFETSDDDTDFKSLLEKKANKGNRYADEMLKYYERLSIDLTKPVLKDSDMESKKKWSFQEKNSKISFEFTLHNYMWETMWEITPIDEEDIEKYMLRILTGYDNKTQEEDDELQQIEEAIKTRIRNQYNNRYNDNEIMSGDFYSVFSKAQEKYISDIDCTDCDIIGWPDWDIWECTNGPYAEIFSVDVEIITKSNAIAHVKLIYPENGEYRDIDFPMVYEKGNWYVDDIINITNSYSIKDMAQSIVDKR